MDSANDIRDAEGVEKPATALHPAIDKLHRIETELNSYLINRTDEIRGALLALLSRQHVFYLSSPGTGKCVTGDTRILDPNTGALRSIAELADNASWNGDVVAMDAGLTLSPHRSVAIARQGVKPVFELVTRAGRRIRATANHPFYTYDGWRRLEEIGIGTQIASPRSLPYFGKGSPDPALVSLLGVLIGDGCILTRTPFYSAAVGSGIHDVVRHDATSLGMKVKPRPDGKSASITDPQANRSRPNRLTQTLKDVGLHGHGSATKFVPEIIMTARRELVSLFLNRLFRTDGCIFAREQGTEVSYTTISRRLADDVQHLLLRFGIVAKIRVRQPAVYRDTDKRAYTLCISGLDQQQIFVDEIGAVGKENAVEKLRLSLLNKKANTNVDVIPRGVWRDIDSAMTTRSWLAMNTSMNRSPYDRWYRADRQMSRTQLLKIADYTSDELLQSVGRSDLWWDSVVSIEPAGRAETFDIEVTGVHNFVANDLLVHNSYLVSEICRRLRGAEFFKSELNAFTLRDELFGPISLRALRENDALERKYAGFLPSATVAQLDEIWKAPPALLNTLLTLLNEREFRNDADLLRTPLAAAFVTSNETPPADHSLDALYDRILLRYQVAPLTDVGQRRAATARSLALRAFETTARAIATEVIAARAKQLAADQESFNAELDTEIADLDTVIAHASKERGGMQDLLDLAERFETMKSDDPQYELAEKAAAQRATIATRLEELAAVEEFTHAERSRKAESREEQLEIIRATSEAQSLSMRRPERWLIDRFGELFSDPQLRSDVDNARFSERADEQELLKRMLQWADDRNLEMPYRTFISSDELDAVQRIVMEVTFPEKVEDAFYHIIDAHGGGVSVRRETELRTVVAAQSVLMGRTSTSIDDLAVVAHALWNTPSEILGAKRTVADVLNVVRREVDAMLATITQWRDEPDPQIGHEKLNRRRQMDAEIERFSAIADSNPGNEQVAEVLAEARRMREEFNARMVPDGMNENDPARLRRSLDADLPRVDPED